MTKIILVRHGQTEWNLLGKYQGQSDVSLSRLGIEQAGLAARRFAGEKLTAVYASNLSRAFQTAQIIAEPHRLPVHELAGVRELSFGIWEGLTYAEINEKWSAELEMMFNKAGAARIPEGETFAEVTERAVAAVEAVVRDNPDGTVLIVSHGAAIRTILAHYMHIPIDYLWCIRQDNTACNILTFFDDGRQIIELINDTHHLLENS